MDIYKRLIRDHDKQRNLCARILETEGASDTRKTLWKELSVELDAHAAAEEQSFYAELMERPEGTDKARHSVHEHQQMEELVEELNELDLENTGWLNKFKKLEHQVIHHVDEEEEEVFPKAKKLISAEKAKELAAKFNERKPEEVEDKKSA